MGPHMQKIYPKFHLLLVLCAAISSVSCGETEFSNIEASLEMDGPGGGQDGDTADLTSAGNQGQGPDLADLSTLGSGSGCQAAGAQALDPSSISVTVKAEKYLQVRSAQANINADGTHSEHRPGLARGIYIVSLPSPELMPVSISASIHTVDFFDFQFSQLSQPVLNPETCLWTSKFEMEWQFRYVGKKVEYLDQEITLELPKNAGTIRRPWNVNLRPSELSPNAPTQEVGRGTQGFSQFSPK